MVRKLVKRVVKRIVAGAPRVPGAPPTGRTPPTSRAPAPPSEPAPAPEPEDDLEVEGAWVASRLAAGDALLCIDIREPHELRQGHGRGALLLPMNEVPQRLSELPRDRPLVVYCAAGARSWGVTHYLREQGFAEAVSLAGGFADLADATGEWEQPAPGPLALLQSVRMTDEARKAAGLTDEDPSSATVQSVQERDGVLAVALWLPGPEGSPGRRIDGLALSDLIVD